MKFYFIFHIFIFYLCAPSQAQTKDTAYPKLDRRVDKVKRPAGASLSGSALPKHILAKAFFSHALAFETGDASLNFKGEEQLNQFIINIDEAIQIFRSAYPTSPLVLKISIAEDEKMHCLLCVRRTNEIYQYLMERLVQAGNVQIRKEVVKVKMPKPQELSSLISVDNLLESQK
jgi:hypothetical protein